ncbi:MAG: protoporphyrinogen oxidase, partial [Acidobacteria bacterium]|nr:protoporphyrinogen oxidase [Acidobacteriota bacterium]
MIDVAVVGGGIAGLATAYELSRRQRSFVVFERAPRAGGVILSEEVDGFTIDGGPDALLVQKPDGIRLCEELGLGDRLISTKPPRLAYIQRGGRLHPLPAASVLGIPTRFGPFIRTRLFSWPGKLRMGAEIFVAPRREDGDESIGAFVTRRFGREAATYLAEPLLAGIHAGDVDRLSVQALFPRFVEAERAHGSLLRAFSRRSQGPASSSDGAFRSLPGGLSEMVRALVRSLGSDRVRTGATVSAITGRGPFEVRISGGETIDARAVVLATPAFQTSALMRDRDDEIARLAGEIPYASAATIALAFKRDAVPHPLNGSGFVVPRVEQTGILAGSWLSSKWPNRAPDGHALLRTFVGGARDPQALQKSDHELVTLSLAA